MAAMGVLSTAAAGAAPDRKATFPVKALSQICGVCEAEGCSVSLEPWLDGDEARISRLDKQNYCAVLDVSPLATGRGVQLQVQVYSGSCSASDPAKSRIEWPGGSSIASRVSLGRAPGFSCDCILRGTMAFADVPGQESLLFKFGGEGYSWARLGVAEPQGLQEGSLAAAAQQPEEPWEAGQEKQPPILSTPAASRTVNEEDASTMLGSCSSSSSNSGSDGGACVATLTETLSQLSLSQAVGPAEGRCSEELNVTVMSMSGCEINSLRATPSDTVFQVKQRIARLSGTDVGHLQLVHDCTRLSDSDTLGGACGVGAAPRASLMGALGELQAQEAPQPPVTELVLYCIQLKRSSIAIRFESLRDSKDPKAQLASSIADVADSVMQFESSTSDQRRPTAEGVLSAIQVVVRSRLIAWMIEAFDVLQLDCNLLFGTVLTLDRYCDAMGSPREQSELGLALLAAICTELKLARADLFHSEYMKRLLHHMCQGHFALEDILRTEYRMVTKLDFAMWVPSTVTFFGGLSLRFANGGDLDAVGDQELRWLWLGMLLLHIALLDVDLQYGYSHAVLAAAALSGAMGVCEAPEEHREGLFQDLAAYRPATAGLEDQELIFECEERLLQLWSDCSTGESPHADFFGALEARFASPMHHRVARLSPRARLSELRRLRSGADIATLMQERSPKTEASGTAPRDNGRQIHYNAI